MLLSVDWDFFVGTQEHVFDSPFWGSPDQPFERHARWRKLAEKRGGTSFETLRQDFPLLEDASALRVLRGLPVVAAQSHEAALVWLSQHAPGPVLNLDSHHDLYAQSGNPTRPRPGNWAGLALQAKSITAYTCVYPNWHTGVRVCEGYDLARTQNEVAAHLPQEILDKLNLQRNDAKTLLNTLPLEAVQSVLVVQSPAWTNPCFDELLLEILADLKAQTLPGCDAVLHRRF